MWPTLRRGVFSATQTRLGAAFSTLNAPAPPQTPGNPGAPGAPGAPPGSSPNNGLLGNGPLYSLFDRAFRHRPGRMQGVMVNGFAPGAITVRNGGPSVRLGDLLEQGAQLVENERASERKQGRGSPRNGAEKLGTVTPRAGMAQSTVLKKRQSTLATDDRDRTIDTGALLHAAVLLSIEPGAGHLITGHNNLPPAFSSMQYVHDPRLPPEVEAIRNIERILQKKYGLAAPGGGPQPGAGARGSSLLYRLRSYTEQDLQNMGLPSVQGFASMTPAQRDHVLQQYESVFGKGTFDS